VQHIRHIHSASRLIATARPAFPCLFASLAIVLATAAAGCSSNSGPSPDSASLLTGDRRANVAQYFAPAARIAHRFAVAYARSVYLRRPVRLPGVTAALAHRLATAAARVPPARRGLHPWALAVALRPRDAKTLAGAVEIGDGRSPPFSVGFLVKQLGSRWRVISISPPG
jgi:hypothetical protein